MLYLEPKGQYKIQICSNLICMISASAIYPVRKVDPWGPQETVSICCYIHVLYIDNKLIQSPVLGTLGGPQTLSLM